MAQWDSVGRRRRRAAVPYPPVPRSSVRATRPTVVTLTVVDPLPFLDMVALETVTNEYLGGDASLACSAETQAEVDRQVRETVKTQHEKALGILRDNRAKLDELAKHLYEKETITGDEFMQILNAKS